VHRSLLAGLAPFRIRRLAGEQRRHDLLLVRNDRGEDVGDHDRADDGADLVEGAAAREDVGENVGKRYQENVAADGEGEFMTGEAAAAGAFVQQEGECQAAEGEQGGLTW
jgi:hypothetical protein